MNDFTDFFQIMKKTRVFYDDQEYLLSRVEITGTLDKATPNVVILEIAESNNIVVDPLRIREPQYRKISIDIVNQNNDCPIVKRPFNRDDYIALLTPCQAKLSEFSFPPPDSPMNAGSTVPKPGWASDGGSGRSETSR